MKGRPAAERTIHDRWLLSELASLTGRMAELMDGYRAYEAASALTDFVDGLSNWYLRRSRPRYWKAEHDADKEDAYATLYEALVTLAKLAAPFVPFMTEEMYQNLVVGVFGGEAPESVHLCDYPVPAAERIDRPLSEEMAVVRQAVSLGLRVRTEHKLRVRQPLARAEVVLAHPELEGRLEPYRALIAEELNVKELAFVHGGEEHVRYGVKPNYRRLGPRLGKKMPAAKAAFLAADGSALRRELLRAGRGSIRVEEEVVRLEPEDVEIVVEAKEGYAAAGDQTAVVVLSTALTPELVEEGIYREILNRVQTFRKELELEYTQRIRLAILGSERVREIVRRRAEHLKGETLCVELRLDGSPPGDAQMRQLELDGGEAELYLALA
jgi:isoleucyl-tRNA synthetase